VHEDLLNAVSCLVHRHVLRELHNMTGAMLARLDGGGADLSTQRNSAPLPTAVGETGAGSTLAASAPTVKRSTIERAARKRRAKERASTANGTVAPPAASDWPKLRQAVRAEASARSLDMLQLARELDMNSGSLATWLSRTRAPSVDTMTRLRAWLASRSPATPEAAPVADGPAPIPPFRLDEHQRDQLAGHVQLGDKRQLRRDLGLSEETIGMAVGGRELPLEAFERITAYLANGAAEVAGN
jgi:hypothetical protein